MSAICLVSGGMDSLLTVALAAQEFPSQLSFIHFNYGQRTHRKELSSYQQIADHYQVPSERRKVINLNFLSEIGGSALTDQSISLQTSSGQTTLPTSYVPFRNTIFLSLAVSWAEVIQAKKIFIGAVQEDFTGYPDCRPSYYQAMNEVIRQGSSRSDLQIVTPIIHMTKEEIVAKAVTLKAPLQWTWSCYSREDVPCGVCDSCDLRAKGFAKAGVADPIVRMTTKV